MGKTMKISERMNILHNIILYTIVWYVISMWDEVMPGKSIFVLVIVGEGFLCRILHTVVGVWWYEGTFHP